MLYVVFHSQNSQQLCQFSTYIKNTFEVKILKPPFLNFCTYLFFHKPKSKLVKLVIIKLLCHDRF